MNTGDRVYVCQPRHTFGLDDWRWEIQDVRLVASGPELSAITDDRGRVDFSPTRLIHADVSAALRYVANNDVRRDPAVIDWLRETDQPIIVETK